MSNRRASTGQEGRAHTPAQIPLSRWLQVIRRALTEARQDDVPVLAGGVAFFAFLALFPTILAALTLYGLVADPSEVGNQVQQLAALLPGSAQPLIVDHLAALTTTSKGTLSFRLVVSLIVALWSASGGTTGLIRAVNTAYDEKEERGFLKLRGIALALTLGAFVFGLLAVALVAVVPVVFTAVGLAGTGLLLAQVLRWVLLVALIVALLAVIYRVGPDRNAPRLLWATTGAVVATVLWVLASVAFSLYVNHFAGYAKTYGPITGVIVLMLWFYITAYLILLGAEINAESEQQSEREHDVDPNQQAGEFGAR